MAIVNFKAFTLPHFSDNLENTNAPTIMMAEKISDHINGRTFLSN